MNMTQMLKTSQSLMKRSAIAAALLLAGGGAQAGVIYSDTFARTGTLNGSTPDTTSGLYGGTSGATWQAVTAATTGRLAVGFLTIVATLLLTPSVYAAGVPSPRLSPRPGAVAGVSETSVDLAGTWRFNSMADIQVPSSDNKLTKKK